MNHEFQEKLHEQQRFDLEVAERLKAQKVHNYLYLREVLLASLELRLPRKVPQVEYGIPWNKGSLVRKKPLFGRIGIHDFAEAMIRKRNAQGKSGNNSTGSRINPVSASHSPYDGVLQSDDVIDNHNHSNINSARKRISPPVGIVHDSTPVKCKIPENSCRYS